MMAKLGIASPIFFLYSSTSPFSTSLIISSASLAAVIASSPSSSSMLATSPNLSRQNLHLSLQKPCFPFHSGPPFLETPYKGLCSCSSSHTYISTPRVSIQATAAGTYASRGSVTGNWFGGVSSAVRKVISANQGNRI